MEINDAAIFLKGNLLWKEILEEYKKQSYPKGDKFI